LAAVSYEGFSHFPSHRMMTGSDSAMEAGIGCDSVCSEGRGDIPPLPVILGSAAANVSPGCTTSPRAPSAEAMETGVASTAGTPQTLDGKQYWAESWGITRSQCLQLLTDLREDPTWDREYNLYHLVTKYVKPWTAGKGVGYALMVNQGSPKVVNLMVSHAWSENAEEFLECLIRTASEDDVMFVCALSLYQCEDGAGPTIEEQLGTDPEESPFGRVLIHIRNQGDLAGWKWRHRHILTMLPRLLAFVAVWSYILPILADGCVPGFMGCASPAFYPGSYAQDKMWTWNPWSADHLPANATSELSIDAAMQRFSQDVHAAASAGALDDLAPTPTLMPGWMHVAFVGALIFGIASIIAWAALWLSPPIYHGRMVAVPNREDDLYTRLWCVYEIFIAKCKGVPVQLAYTMASAGTCSSSAAKCSSTADMERIRSEIQGEGRGDKGFDMIDQAVLVTTHATRRSIACIIALDLLLSMSLLGAFAQLQLRGLVTMYNTVTQAQGFGEQSSETPAKMDLGDVQHFVIIGVAGAFATCALIIVGLYWVAKVPQGRPSRRRLCFFALCLMALAIVMAIAGFALRASGAVVLILMGVAVYFMLTSSGSVLCYVAWHKCCWCRQTVRYCIQGVGFASIPILPFFYRWPASFTSYPDFVDCSLQVLAGLSFQLASWRWASLWDVHLKEDSPARSAA